MNRHRKRNSHIGETAFLNFAITLAKALMIMLLVVFALISQNKKVETEGIKPNAQYVIILRWDDNDPSDVDTYTLTPEGHVVYYHNTSSGLVNLDRDDTGSANDTTVINGQRVLNPINEEITSIRGVPTGDYAVNIHLYRYGEVIQSKQDNGTQDAGKDGDLPRPITATVIIQKLNPDVEIIYSAKVQFTKYNQELHICRFTIEQNGNVDNVTNERPLSIVSKVATPGTLIITPEGSE